MIDWGQKYRFVDRTRYPKSFLKAFSKQFTIKLHPGIENNSIKTFPCFVHKQK